MKVPKIVPPIWMFLFMFGQLILDAAYPIIRFSFTYQVNVGIFIMILGAVINFFAARRFKEEGVEIKPLEEDSAKLITDGLYRFSRNPMYLGMFFLMTGAAVSLGSLSAFVPMLLFYGFILFFYVEKEEKALTEQFGEEYTQYRSKVRRWV